MELTSDIPYLKGSIILCIPSSTTFSDKEQMCLLKSVHAAVTTWNETLFSVTEMLTDSTKYPFGVLQNYSIFTWLCLV